jgi:hypothetical protein
MSFIVAIVAMGVFMIFGIAAIAIISEHIQKMAKIRADGATHGHAETAAAIEALRREVAALRDTSTTFDMSFDSALQRLESRVSHLEDRPIVPAQAAEEPRQTVGAGRQL